MDEIKKSLAENTKLRWGVLLLISFSMATNYYFYDALSPLKDALTRNLGFSSTDYGVFVSAYSVPNVFLAMAVIGGVILDKIGIRKTGTLFIASMVAGGAVTWYGASDTFNSGGPGHALLSSFLTDYKPSLKMMFIGFFLFGLGAETSCVVISKICVKWFKGKELALALGLNIAIARMGMGAALLISPRLMVGSWTRPIWFGTLLLVAGLFAFIVYIFFDVAYDRRTAETTGTEPDEEFRFSDIGKLLVNPSFMFIALLCVTFYSAVFPFVKFAPELMTDKFGVTLETAGLITTILPFGTIVFTPLFGWICDFKGKSASLMILGSFLLVVVHVLFSLTAITPYVPMFILGVAFSLVPAAMWPSLAKIVPENRLGTAYGLMFSIQNIGLWLFPMAIGAVLDWSNPGVSAAKTAGDTTAVFDYTNPILMLAGLGVFGLVFAFLLLRSDRKQGYGLELPNKAPAAADSTKA